MSTERRRRLAMQRQHYMAELEAIADGREFDHVPEPFPKAPPTTMETKWWVFIALYVLALVGVVVGINRLVMVWS